MKLQPLIIGDLVVKYPIIQGGMGVGVSRSRLAGAVAKVGGMGIISTAQIGYDEPEFEKNALLANFKAIKKHVRLAKEQAEGGVVGVNIMVATKRYEDYVKTAIEAGVDVIISGAGLPVDLPKYAEGSKAKIAPIVSSVKAVNVILRMWDRKYARTADFVVIEGPLAGGHLGFAPKDLEDINALDYDTQIQEMIAAVKVFEEKYKVKIPVIVAGGIFDHEDILHALSLGADGVQIASRFVVTEECDASEAYKQAYLMAKSEDVKIVVSPVGMPGRAILNPFMEKVKIMNVPVTRCHNCLEHCNPATIPYCITKALINAVKGDLKEGLIFCGANVDRLQKMTTVPELMEELVGESIAIMKKKAI